MTIKKFKVWTVNKVSEQDIINYLLGVSDVGFGGLFWTREKALASMKMPHRVYEYRLKIGVAT